MALKYLPSDTRFQSFWSETIPSDDEGWYLRSKQALGGVKLRSNNNLGHTTAVQVNPGFLEIILAMNMPAVFLQSSTQSIVHWALQKYIMLKVYWNIFKNASLRAIQFQGKKKLEKSKTELLNLFYLALRLWEGAGYSNYSLHFWLSYNVFCQF